MSKVLHVVGNPDAEAEFVYEAAGAGGGWPHAPVGSALSIITERLFHYEVIKLTRAERLVYCIAGLDHSFEQATQRVLSLLIDSSSYPGSSEYCTVDPATTPEWHELVEVLRRLQHEGLVHCRMVSRTMMLLLLQPCGKCRRTAADV